MKSVSYCKSGLCAVIAAAAGLVLLATAPLEAQLRRPAPDFAQEETAPAAPEARSEAVFVRVDEAGDLLWDGARFVFARSDAVERGGDAEPLSRTAADPALCEAGHAVVVGYASAAGPSALNARLSADRGAATAQVLESAIARACGRAADFEPVVVARGRYASDADAAGQRPVSALMVTARDPDGNRLSGEALAATLDEDRAGPGFAGVVGAALAEQARAGERPVYGYERCEPVSGDADRARLVCAELLRVERDGRDS